jgi:hypothetical protein
MGAPVLINGSWYKALDLPASVLARADEVIE